MPRRVPGDSDAAASADPERGQRDRADAAAAGQGGASADAEERGAEVRAGQDGGSAGAGEAGGAIEAGERGAAVGAGQSGAGVPPAGEGGGVDVVARHTGRGRLFRRTAWVSALTLVSRLLGFVREMLSAYLFGDRSGVYDAFITAWRVPNLFRRFLGEGALSTALQRAITAEDGDRGEAAGARLFTSTLRLVGWILLALCGALMLAVHLMPDRMPLTGFAWLGQDPAAVRELTVRLLPFVVLICASALVGGALFVRGHYTTPNLAPAVLNLGWIAALVLVGWRFGWIGPEVPERHLAMTRVLAWGVLVSGLLQLVIQVPPLIRHRLLTPRRGAQAGGARAGGAHAGGAQAGGPKAGGVHAGGAHAGGAQAGGGDERVGGAGGARPTVPRATPWGVLRSSAPLAFGAAVYQINVMVDGLMAESLLPDGGPTAHYYANRVQQFPLALVSIAAVNAVFPALTALGHRGDRAGLRSLHDRTQRAVAFVALPASLGLFLLAPEIVRLCFEHGAFGAEGTARTTAGLRAATLSILPAGAVGLVARTYYAVGDFARPVTASVLALVLNSVLNLVLIVGVGMDVEGLALGTAIASWAHLALLVPGLVTRLGLPPSGATERRGLPRMLLATALSGGAALAVHRGLAGALGEPLALLPAIGAAVVTLLAAARALGIPEARRWWPERRSGAR